MILRIICGVTSCTVRVACLKGTVTDEGTCAMCKCCTRRHDCKSTNMQTKDENAKEEVLQMPVMHKRQKPLQGLSAVRPRSLLKDTSTMLGGKFDTLLERRDEKSFLCCICFTRLCLQPHLPLPAAVTVCLAAAAAPAPGRSVQLSSWLVTSACEALQEVILRFCFPSRYKCTIFSHLEDTSHSSSLSSGEGKSRI